MQHQKELISEIRSRIEFLVAIAIFFLAFVYFFYRAIGSDDTVSNSVPLTWGIGVAFCILNYLFVGFASVLKEKALVWIRHIVSLNIFSFVPPIIILALMTKNPLPGYCEWPLIISLEGTLWIPIVTFILILYIMDWKIFCEIYSSTKKLFKRNKK